MQLLNSSLLWGLLAVGIPIAIHLLQLRQPKRILFTNIGFIREVELTTMRKRHLQELLVLLMRVLVVASLVLMFAQPFIPARQTRANAGTDNSVEVMLDNSPSMRVQDVTGKNLLQEAIAGGQALGKSYGPNGRFHLINYRGEALTTAAYNEQLLSSYSTNKNSIGWGGTSMRRLFQSESRQPLYVFSDFQKSERGAEVLKYAPIDKSIVLIPQVAQPTSNVYVDSVWVEDAFIRKYTNTGLHIRLRNGGTESVADCPVKVMLGEKQVAAFRTTVGVGQASSVVVQIQLADSRLALGKVVAEDTPVTADNTYYFTLQPAAAIRVMEIGNAEPVARQAYANEPLFSYTFAKLQGVDYNQLKRTNLVIINELTQMDVGLRQVLAEVVHTGGSVVVVPSSQTASHESYHQLFRALGVGGEQWNTAATGQPVLQGIAMPNGKNPFFKDVFGAQPRQVAMPQAAPVLSWGRNGSDILRLQDGDSYLTEFESGSGRVYVFAAPFDKTYSDFTAHALFVPVLYRMAMLSYYTDQRLAYRLATPTIVVDVPSGPDRLKEDASFRLVQDSLIFVPAQRVQGQEAHLNVPAEMTKPGFYQVRQGTKLVTTVAFNANSHESELAAYSAVELRELIGPNRPNIQVLENGAKPEVLTHYRATQTGQPLWRYCLMLALVCLFIEALILRFKTSKTPVSGRTVAA